MQAAVGGLRPSLSLVMELLTPAFVAIAPIVLLVAAKHGLVLLQLVTAVEAMAALALLALLGVVACDAVGRAAVVVLRHFGWVTGTSVAPVSRLFKLVTIVVPCTFSLTLDPSSRLFWVAVAGQLGLELFVLVMSIPRVSRWLCTLVNVTGEHNEHADSDSVNSETYLTFTGWAHAVRMRARQYRVPRAPGIFLLYRQLQPLLASRLFRTAQVWSSHQVAWQSGVCSSVVSIAGTVCPVSLFATRWVT